MIKLIVLQIIFLRVQSLFIFLNCNFCYAQKLHYLKKKLNSSFIPKLIILFAVPAKFTWIYFNNKVINEVYVLFYFQSSFGIFFFIKKKKLNKIKAVRLWKSNFFFYRKILYTITAFNTKVELEFQNKTSIKLKKNKRCSLFDLLS